MPSRWRIVRSTGAAIPSASRPGCSGFSSTGAAPPAPVEGGIRPGGHRSKRPTASVCSTPRRRTCAGGDSRGLGHLVPEQREAFLLKYVEEMSYEEMAELTGAGESALKMRVKRACERLRDLLGDSDAS